MLGTGRRTCVDIDGVLCADPTQVQNDDGPGYRSFLSGAQPLVLPTSPVGWVVTSRLERYRPETEAWLRENGVEYGELVMLDVATAEERRALGAHGRHEAAFSASSGAELFVESEYAQAVEIAALSGRQVFSIEGAARAGARGAQPPARGAGGAAAAQAPARLTDVLDRSIQNR